MSSQSRHSGRPLLAAAGHAPAPSAAEPLSLDAAVSHLLDQCRMVLPGVQALFGFQLIAVFESDFVRRLAAGEQRLHLAALALVALAVALLMAPAALHRQADPRVVTERYLRAGSRLLVAGMVALALAIAAEVYLVSRLVLGGPGGSAAIAGATLGVFLVLWFVLPRTGVGR